MIDIASFRIWIQHIKQTLREKRKYSVQAIDPKHNDTENSWQNFGHLCKFIFLR